MRKKTSEAKCSPIDREKATSVFQAVTRLGRQFRKMLVARMKD